MFVLTIHPGEIRVPVDPGDTIDAALSRAGYIRPRKGCRRGGCGQCRVHLDAGTTVDERPVADMVLSVQDRRHGAILPCRAQPTSDVEITIASGVVRCVSPIQRAIADRRLAAAHPLPGGH